MSINRIDRDRARYRLTKRELEQIYAMWLIGEQPRYRDKRLDDGAANIYIALEHEFIMHCREQGFAYKD